MMDEYNCLVKNTEYFDVLAGAVLMEFCVTEKSVEL